jgi:hypothetical protein
MKGGFYAAAAGLLFAIARGWLWLGVRMSGRGDHVLTDQFFLGLLGLSISMAEIDSIDAVDRASAKTRDAGSPASHLTGQRRYRAERPQRMRHPGGAKARPREVESKLHRRSAFRAEDSKRCLRMR